jgi:hypothetical protein
VPRKKWRIVYPGSPEVDTLPSEARVYEFVDAMRSSWAAGAPDSAGSLTVQVDEGFGWTPYEHINFAEERV